MKEKNGDNPKGAISTKWVMTKAKIRWMRNKDTVKRTIRNQKSM